MRRRSTCCGSRGSRRIGLRGSAVRKLRDDAAADLSWLQGAAAGSILAPGPEALEALLSARGGDMCLQRHDRIARPADAITIGGGSPLRRYSRSMRSCRSSARSIN